MDERTKTECKCCGRAICYPPALVCTACAMTDPEAKVWLEIERAGYERSREDAE